jgi:SAM-dependent methyltransferase
MEGIEVRKLTELEDRHWWYRERRNLLRRAVDGLTPGVAVDVGAAGGGNTRVLQGLGWQVAAIEYGEEGAQVAGERGLPVLRGDATRLPVAAGSLDLVVAFDVLEHIDDDKAAATGVFEALKPGGTFLVAVPGFTLDSVRSWNVLLRPAVALRRRKSTGSDLDDMPGWLNAALYGVVVAERYLPVGSLPGVSLLVTARRER